MKRIYQQPNIIVSIVDSQALLDTSIHEGYGDEQYSKNVYDLEETDETNKSWGALW